MIELLSYSLNGTQLLVLLTVAMLIGMGKAGIYGCGMIAVPMLALAFGGKASTGLMLPILIFADLFAVYYYHRHANWHHLKSILPFAIIGIVFGTIVGEVISDELFRQLMAVIIFMCLVLMIWQEKGNQRAVPSTKMLAGSIGITGGFATMVGNLAGPVMALYLLAMRMPKAEFIGTAAWFFLVVNVSKMPFHIFVWETITWDSFSLNLILIPAIALGAFLGIKLTKLIPETPFRWFVIFMTALSAISLVV